MGQVNSMNFVIPGLARNTVQADDGILYMPPQARSHPVARRNDLVYFYTANTRQKTGRIIRPLYSWWS
ncbi:hypothetical protein SAMN05216315_11010 [Nitrosospira sp. Nsp18]|nr:hypothetical protein SAMN05216315_11010 [Nitrosospira sp. Nsp18]